MSFNRKKKFFGKYRGVVFNNIDPEFKGRIQATVSDLLGYIPTTWALPCVPITGMTGAQSGIYVVPAINASVWIEFERGDLDYPIWSGCFWGSQAEIPLAAQMGAPPTPNIVLQTIGQNCIVMGGTIAQGIILSAGPPIPGSSPSIVISPAGIMITDGKGGLITIAGGVVQINQGALVIK
jgi:hypothetical protein